MNKNAFVLLILIAAIGSSCKRQKITATTGTVKTEEKAFAIQEIDFKYFDAKSRITYKDAENDVTATLNIRMKKDSIIWLSASKVGIEGIRSLITLDSIFVVDKLKNEYTAYDFKTLSEKFNFDISFDLLQAAILGNLPFSLNAAPTKMIRNDTHYLLRQQQQSVSIDNYVSVDNNKLTKILLTDQPTHSTLTVNYENFAKLSSYLFPYHSQLSLQYQSPEGPSNTLITIQHLKAELSDSALNFPFNVSPKYDRK